MRAVALLLTALLLAGCADSESERERKIAAQYEQKLAQERERVDTLASRLDTRYAERLAEIEYWDRQARIAAACDYLVPMCPNAVAAPGREAQAEGYSGGGAAFWMLVILKFVVMALGAVATVAALSFSAFTVLASFNRILQPSRTALAEARRLVQTNDESLKQTQANAEQEAQEIVTHAELEAARIKAQTTTAQNELKTALQSLQQVKKDLGKTQAALDEARDELEKTKSARDLLSGF